MVTENKFANIAKLPVGYQIKLKTNGKELQIFAANLELAIKERNKHYENGYIPNGILLKVPNLKDCIKKTTVLQKSGNPVDVYQVHSRFIFNNKYSPRKYVSKTDAKHFARIWLDSYLPVMELYNLHQKARLKCRAKSELKTLTPWIKRAFEKSLWDTCVFDIHGNKVPIFGNFDK